MGERKHWDELADELRRQGWTVTQTGRGHLQAVPPDRSQGIVHFSHSEDHHAFKNTVRDLRRRGFQWPPPSKNDEAVERRAARETAPVSTTHPEDWIEEHNSAVEAAAPPPPPPETHEAKMERLFNELKEAKAYYALTNEHARECEAKLLAAQREMEEAAAERTKAQQALVAKKAEFDSAFEAAA